MKKTDVLIIGAGVNGCSIAYNLVKKGFDVTVVEKDYVASGASGRNGGGIRQQWSTEDNIRLAMESVKIFERLDEELNYETEYTQGGYLVIAHTEEEVKQFKRNVALQRKLGLPVEYLDASEINEIVPQLNVEGIGALGATWCPTDGHADPIKVTLAYYLAAKRLGAKIIKHTKVIGFKKGKDNRITSVLTDKGEIETKYVVNSAGAYSAEVAKLAGVSLPNKPYRHEILITEPVKRFFTPMIISFHDNVYFRQTLDGNIIGGWGDPEEKPGFKLESTKKFLYKMAWLLSRYMPILKNVRVLRQWAGLYDVTPDARPILGPSEGVENLIQVNGFSGHGFMVSPMTAKIISQYIAGEKTVISLENLGMSRFKGKILKERSVVG